MDNYISSFEEKVKEIIALEKEQNIKHTEQNKHLLEVKNCFSESFNKILEDLTLVINAVPSEDKNKETTEEESPASKVFRKPQFFEKIPSIENHINFESETKINNTQGNNFVNIKIRSQIEEGIEDSIELYIHNQGESSDGSGFMLGFVPFEGEFPIGRYPGMDLRAHSCGNPNISSHGTGIGAREK